MFDNLQDQSYERYANGVQVLEGYSEYKFVKMINTSPPDDWRDLQRKVARILSDCGFEVEVEKVVKLVRGKAEIDVYAEEVVDGRKYSLVCECKYWKNSIPQSIVQGFRTILSDLGANVGYIITTSAYQSGSVNAAHLTNVELLTWDQFQSAFFETWFENHLIPTVTEDLDPLMTYSEPFFPKWFDQMSPSDKKHYVELKEEYDAFGIVMMSLFTPYKKMLGDKEIPELPLRSRLKFTDSGSPPIPDRILDATGYREFLNMSLKYGQEAIRRFRELQIKYTN